jgi:tripartite-type tricarboxylate transporter receptor subunit TctC
MNYLGFKSEKSFGGAIATSVLATGVLLAACPAGAQSYPAREIRVISAYVAGSGADTLTRYYSDKLSALAGKPVIVENKAGGDGVIGTEYAVRAKPDGYTIFITPTSNITAAPHLFKNLPYDPMRDFAAVAPIMRLNFVIAVDGRSPIRSIGELVAHLRTRAERGSYGMGNKTGLVSVELFKDMAGLKTVQINYKSAAQAVTDLVGGQLDFMIWDATFLSSQARSGRIRLLAVTGASRSGALPDIPTMAESGFPGFDMTAWFGVLVPSGTPKAIVDRLAGWMGQINAMEETRKFLYNSATDVLTGTPESMAALLKQETERWARLLKLAKIEPQ